MVTIVETVTNPQTLSIVLELATLFFIVLGFFRWYDRKYAATLDKTVKGIDSKIDDVKTQLGNLAENYHDYVQDRALQKSDDKPSSSSRRGSKR